MKHYRMIKVNNHEIISEKHGNDYTGEMTRYECIKCHKNDWNGIKEFENNKCKKSDKKK